MAPEDRTGLGGTRRLAAPTSFRSPYDPSPTPRSSAGSARKRPQSAWLLAHLAFGNREEVAAGKIVVGEIYLRPSRLQILIFTGPKVEGARFGPK